LLPVRAAQSQLPEPRTVRPRARERLLPPALRQVLQAMVPRQAQLLIPSESAVDCSQQVHAKPLRRATAASWFPVQYVPPRREVLQAPAMEQRPLPVEVARAQSPSKAQLPAARAAPVERQQQEEAPAEEQKRCLRAAVQRVAQMPMRPHRRTGWKQLQERRRKRGSSRATDRNPRWFRFRPGPAPIPRRDESNRPHPARTRVAQARARWRSQASR